VVGTKQYLWDLSRNRMPIGQWLKSVMIAVYNKVAHIGKFHGWGTRWPGDRNGDHPLACRRVIRQSKEPDEIKQTR
jgi:hypothetical protein